MEKLYVIVIPGPDNIYAAPSYKVALLMKKQSDETVNEWFEAMRAKGEAVHVSLDSCIAVIEEMEDAQEHADLLKEFKYEEWNIAEADLVEKNSPQTSMFESGAGK